MQVYLIFGAKVGVSQLKASDCERFGYLCRNTNDNRQAT